MRRSIRILSATLAALALGTPPAFAAPPDAPVSVWGSSGMILVPTPHTLEFNAMQLTGGYFGRAVQPMGSLHVGLLKDFEAGVVYAAPGTGNALAGDFKYRLLRQSVQIPFSLAVGGQMAGLASPAAAFALANQLYLMLGHDLKWTGSDGKPFTIGRAALGFAGNLAGAEVLAGLQIPILQYGSLEAEYVGNRPNQNGLVNVGLSVTPLPWLGVRFASLGDTATAVLDREWYVGAQLSWEVPAGGNPFAATSPAPAKTDAKADEKKPIPAPPVVSPPPTPVESKAPVHVAEAPSPAPTATVTPAPAPNPTPTPSLAPMGVVQGKVVSDGKGVPRIPLQLIGAVTRKAWSEADGTFRFPQVPQGTYKLKVEREGWKPYEQEVIVVPGASEAKVTLVPLPATFKGLVQYAQKGVGGITVSIDSLGISTLTKDDGTYLLQDLPSGTYTITYHRKKELLDKVTLSLGQGETLQRNLTLKAGDVPAPQKATMRGTVSSTAKAPLPGVRITLEGKELTVMTISGPDGGFILRELPAGTYKLSVSKQGFQSRFFSVTVKEGQESRHAIALTPGG